MIAPNTDPNPDDADADPSISAMLDNLRVAVAAGEIKRKEREAARKANELPPDQVSSHRNYPALVTKLKVVAEAYEEFEVAAKRPDGSIHNIRNLMKVLNDSAFDVGTKLYKIGGIDLMQTTLHMYVPRVTHRLIDQGWNEVGGEWYC